ncbi:hypothetical protein [Accumulibacter sp.]|uniref:hypothetical protein n=1 Tax=Accumulibacter sp. TaxID=2053492 RepID=UPI0026098176|nr:hypothetical protein [Accumulibacter sp.]
MNFSDVLKALNQASAFELFRMRAAINRVLDQPQWVDAVSGRLRVGQVVEYFDSQANAACQATIIELRRKQALVLDIATQTRWLISYASINLDGADVQIREQVRRGLGRNEVAVGEVLGFLDREQRERSGKVVRLNDKTVTLLCGGLRWRVAYALLHRVVDARAIEGEVLEIGVRNPEP